MVLRSRTGALMLLSRAARLLDRGKRRQQAVLVGIAALEPARAGAGERFARMQHAGVVDDEQFARRAA